MQKLKEISREYESLKLELSSEENSYFENHNVLDLIEGFERGDIPKWKQIERDCEKKEEFFIQIAKQFGKENGLSDKELTIKISEEILRNTPPNINQFLLIRLMWEIGKEKGSFCLETLDKLIRQILDNGDVGSKEEYYLESLIDIWNYDTDKLIPIDILEAIILLDSKTLKKQYGAMIKAVSYLSNHPELERKRVLVKARKTKRYAEDEYYQEWID